MPKLISILSILLAISLPLISKGEVFVNVTNGYPFYHLEHTLRASEFTTLQPSEFHDPRLPEVKGQGECASNGYFEIYISKDHFPIKAPHCNSDWLKVTMRGSSRGQSGSEEKRILWNQIRAVESGEMNQVKVIVELNPYITITSTDPLTVELDYCNVSFRTASGKYIPHTDPVSKSQ